MFSNNHCSFEGRRAQFEYAIQVFGGERKPDKILYDFMTPLCL